MNRAELTNIIVAAVKARNDVRSKKSPKTSVPSVLEFQKLDPNLSKDGKWGPNTKTAATFYLSSMTDNEIPPVHPALTKTSKGKPVEITWVKPSIETEKVEEVAVKAEPEKKPTKKPEKKPTKKPEKKPTKKAKSRFPDLSHLGTDLNKLGLQSEPHGQDPVIKTNKVDAEETLVEQVTKQSNGLTKNDIRQIVKDIIESDIPSKEIISLLKSLKSELKEHRGIVENKSGALKKDLRLMGLVLN